MLALNHYSFLESVERLVLLEFEGNFTGGDLLVDLSNSLKLFFEEISVVGVDLAT